MEKQKSEFMCWYEFDFFLYSETFDVPFRQLFDVDENTILRTIHIVH